MSEEEKEAFEYFTYFNLARDIDDNDIKKLEILLNLIEKQQKEIEKKNKIIDKMAEMLVEDKEWFSSAFDNYTKQDFIKHFTNLLEKENK